MLNVSRRNKSATLCVADPYLAAAYADAIRKKTGCSVVVANLPETVTSFFNFLKERNLLEEWCERTLEHRKEPITNFMGHKSRYNWFYSAFDWSERGTAYQHRWVLANGRWQEYVVVNNL